jgi:hypothetical protein
MGTPHKIYINDLFVPPFSKREKLAARHLFRVHYRPFSGRKQARTLHSISFKINFLCGRKNKNECLKKIGRACLLQRFFPPTGFFKSIVIENEKNKIFRAVLKIYACSRCRLGRCNKMSAGDGE